MLRHIGPITQDNQFRELAFTFFLASLWSKYASENKWNYFTQKHHCVNRNEMLQTAGYKHYYHDIKCLLRVFVNS